MYSKNHHHHRRSSFLIRPNDGAQTIFLPGAPPLSDLDVRDQFSEPARDRIPRNDGHVRRGLSADGRERAVLVERERARIVRVRIGRLEPRDGAGRRVDGVRGDRVLLVAKRLVGAVRRVQEVVHHAELRRLGLRASGPARREGRQGLGLGQGQASVVEVARIPHVPGRDGVAQLVDAEQFLLLTVGGLPELDVPRAVAGVGARVGAGDQPAGGGLNAEDGSGCTSCG
jgi:hypothetical protein